MPTLIPLMLLMIPGQPADGGKSSDSLVRPAIEPFGSRGVPRQLQSGG
jgi:hypothetical protein